MTGTPIILKCSHEIMFAMCPPKVGERIYCYRCDDMQRVVDDTRQYIIKCQECRYTRRFGQCLLPAEVYASKHMATRSHVIHLLYNGVIEQTRTPDRLTLDLEGVPLW